jgi:hypothetical protein
LYIATHSLFAQGVSVSGTVLLHVTRRHGTRTVRSAPLLIIRTILRLLYSVCSSNSLLCDAMSENTPFALLTGGRRRLSSSHVCQRAEYINSRNRATDHLHTTLLCHTPRCIPCVEGQCVDGQLRLFTAFHDDAWFAGRTRTAVS